MKESKYSPFIFSHGFAYCRLAAGRKPKSIVDSLAVVMDGFCGHEVVLVLAAVGTRILTVMVNLQTKNGSKLSKSTESFLVWTTVQEVSENLSDRPS